MFRKRQAMIDEIIMLKKDKADLQIKLETERAEHKRQDLEIRHMVGLEKNRQEVEIAQARRDALVTLREESIAQEKDRFEKEMKFIKDQFSEEMKRLSSIYEAIIARMPNVSVELTKNLNG